jgi:hypothetical protein
MWKITIAVVIGIFLTISSALAQQTTLAADIPFDFVIKDTVFLAGEYTVSEERGHVLLISSRDGSQHVSVSAAPVAFRLPKEQSDLMFHRYGDNYFLSQLWVEGSEEGSRVPASQLERELALGSAPTQVPIFAMPQRIQLAEEHKSAPKTGVVVRELQERE